jgi:hypothetical protein
MSKIVDFRTNGKAASDPLRKFEDDGRTTALDPSGTSNTDDVVIHIAVAREMLMMRARAPRVQGPAGVPI